MSLKCLFARKDRGLARVAYIVASDAKPQNHNPEPHIQDFKPEPETLKPDP
jgi:hypothetical protein